MSLLVRCELGRLHTVLRVPHPAQHLVGHDEIRAGRHGSQIAVEHGRVHGVGWGFVIREEVVEEVELGFGERGVDSGNFGIGGDRRI